VTDTSAKPPRVCPFRLRTFGTVVLAGPGDETLLGKHGHQRHRLGLLAVLAAAGDKGRTRDQLLLLFWPDAPQTRARHSLEQLLYAIRSSIDESVFARTNPVSLNSDVISSDVGEFHASLEHGDLESAVAVYGGPFLDGFYLGDSPEFEQWLDAERGCLERAYTGALERLAKKAEAVRDYSTAVRWWRKLVETDAVSGAYATGLIRALMNAGDHAGALRYAHQYETVVAEELGASAGPAVADLVAEVRARGKTPPLSSPYSAPVAMAAGVQPNSLRAVAMDAERAQSPRSAGRRAATYALACLVIAAIVGTIAWRRSIQRDTPAVSSHDIRASTRSVAAYELYRRGNDPRLLRTDSGARAGLEYFRQAIALDPNYAAAFAGFARMEKRIAFGDDRQLSRPERLALAEQAALKAVALDDSSADAHATLSLVRRDNYELGSAEAELKRAVALDPANPRFHEYLVQLYVLMERSPEALLEGRRALELDPLAPTANAELAHALLASHRYDDALAQLEKVKSLHPPLNRAGAIAAQCYGRKQMWPQAIAEVQRVSPNAGPRGQAILGYMFAKGGRGDDARRILAALTDRSRRINGDAFDVALVEFGLGNSDQAFIWLNKAVNDRSVAFEWLPTLVEDLRHDPRFDNIRRRLGLDVR
jgi:DNA-binding SARP family transcriptional activator/tetratricopeptide (TPR) repeat protein